MAALNADYKTINLAFTLVNISRTTNATWFNNAAPGTREQTEMKSALRRGGSYDLNVYTVGYVLLLHDSYTLLIIDRFTSGSGKNLLGYATFPSSYIASPKDDGVVRRFRVPLRPRTHISSGDPVLLSPWRISVALQPWKGMFYCFYPPHSSLTILLDADTRSWPLGRAVPHIPGARIDISSLLSKLADSFRVAAVNPAAESAATTSTTPPQKHPPQLGALLDEIAARNFPASTPFVRLLVLDFRRVLISGFAGRQFHGLHV
jgi:hypothetical protein